MYKVCCHGRYTGAATLLATSESLVGAKNLALAFKKGYQHVTVSDETGKIYLQRKDRGCCKLRTVIK